MASGDLWPAGKALSIVPEGAILGLHLSWGHTMSVLSRLILAGFMLAVTAAGSLAQGDSFPDRTIRIVVPFPAGGPTDILARVIAQRMSDDWGQPVVIEN